MADAAAEVGQQRRKRIRLILTVSTVSKMVSAFGEALEDFTATSASCKKLHSVVIHCAAIFHGKLNTRAPNNSSQTASLPGSSAVPQPECMQSSRRT